MDEILVRAFAWVGRGVGLVLDYLNLRPGVGALSGGLRHGVPRKRR